MTQPMDLSTEAAPLTNGEAVHPPETSDDVLEQRLKRLEETVAKLAEEKPAPLAIPVSAITAAPPRDSAFSTVTSLASAAFRSSWWSRPSGPLAFDFLSEIRAIPRMFLDRQFRVSWGATTTVLLLVPLLLTSQWWFPFVGIAIVGPIFDKVIVILGACFGYRVLSREAHRYIAFKTAVPPAPPGAVP